MATQRKKDREMQGMESSVRTTMESLRLACDHEVTNLQQKADSCTASFQKSMESIRTRARETVQNQEEVAKLKANLREAEVDLVKSLAVKTRKEAKRMALMDSILATKLRVEELKSRVQVWQDKRDEYATIMSQQSLELEASEEERNRGSERKGEIQKAISWYNKALGLRIEAGQGVKFIFRNVDVENPSKEYSFIVRHAKDMYTLLHCHPRLNDTKELIDELNRTNGLFKFVRIMREKFQETTMEDYPRHLLEVTEHHQDTSSVSPSAPVSSVSTQMSESAGRKHENQVEHEDKRLSKKVNHGKAARPAVLSTPSAWSLRRSPRFKLWRIRFNGLKKKRRGERPTIAGGEQRPGNRRPRSESRSRDDKILECHCGELAPVQTSWMNENPGRNFRGCGRFSNNFKCGCFVWVDPRTCQFGQMMLPSLCERINRLERNAKKTKLKLDKKENAYVEQVMVNRNLKTRKRRLEMIIIVLIAFVIYAFAE